MFSNYFSCLIQPESYFDWQRCEERGSSEGNCIQLQGEHVQQGLRGYRYTARGRNIQNANRTQTYWWHRGVTRHVTQSYYIYVIDKNMYSGINSKHVLTEMWARMLYGVLIPFVRVLFWIVYRSTICSEDLLILSSWMFLVTSKSAPFLVPGLLSIWLTAERGRPQMGPSAVP